MPSSIRSYFVHSDPKVGFIWPEYVVERPRKSSGTSARTPGFASLVMRQGASVLDLRFGKTPETILHAVRVFSRSAPLPAASTTVKASISGCLKLNLRLSLNTISLPRRSWRPADFGES